MLFKVDGLVFVLEHFLGQLLAKLQVTALAGYFQQSVQEGITQLGHHVVLVAAYRSWAAAFIAAVTSQHAANDFGTVFPKLLLLLQVGQAAGVVQLDHLRIARNAQFLDGVDDLADVVVGNVLDGLVEVDQGEAAFIVNQGAGVGLFLEAGDVATHQFDAVKDQVHAQQVVEVFKAFLVKDALGVHRHIGFEHALLINGAVCPAAGDIQQDLLCQVFAQAALLGQDQGDDDTAALRGGQFIGHLLLQFGNVGGGQLLVGQARLVLAADQRVVGCIGLDGHATPEVIDLQVVGFQVVLPVDAIEHRRAGDVADHERRAVGEFAFAQAFEGEVEHLAVAHGFFAEQVAHTDVQDKQGQHDQYGFGDVDAGGPDAQHQVAQVDFIAVALNGRIGGLWI